MPRPILALALTMWLFLPALADPGLAGYVETESALLERERALSEMAQGLEKWLSGRASLAHTQKTLESVQEQLNKPAPLAELEGLERSMLENVRDFVGSDEPTSERQRALFGTLGELTRDRSLKLAAWRSERLAGMQVDNPATKQWREWERNWLPIWRKEATLTYKLQLKLLKSKGSSEAENAALLREILALRLRAPKTPSSNELKSLQQYSLKRLAILARAAEQLSRLDQKKSRGAVTRLRRLSKKLDSLTSEFRDSRLAFLKTL